MRDGSRRPPREVIPPRDEVERELAFHVEMRTRDLVAGAGFLFGVQPFDALAFAAAFTVLTLAALAASVVPARRASRVGPMNALRTD